ncbi:MAG: hypothetical protein ACTSRU_12390 [Candidatus Hodarchaeales archaeon]
MVFDQSRLESRIEDVIKSAISCRGLSEEEMLSRGIELIVFARNFSKKRITEN